jgi:7-cyano-7-deazaguanine synthase
MLENSSKNSCQNQPAVILLSGGLDSSTVLALANEQGFKCHTLAFDYGQRHRNELEACALIADTMHAASHRVFTLDIGSFGGSALTDKIDVPKDRDESVMNDIPITYVPARNLVFLSIALAYAETLGSTDLFIGVNAIDYSGYPDCRPEFIASFIETANLATKLGVEGQSVTVHTPLLDMTKAQIIREGTKLGVNYAMTHSCYDPSPTGAACGRCDSCVLRRTGFEQAGIDDPTIYAQPSK